MRNPRFEQLLWETVQCYWKGDVCGDRYGHLLDHLALHCTDEQWQILDDTLGLMEDPDGYIVSEVALETPTSPIAVNSD